MRKRFVHKAIIMIVSIIFVVSLAACGGKEQAGKDADPSSVSSGDSNEGSLESSGSGGNGSSTDYDKLAESGIPPVGIGITKFMELKGKSYEMLEPVMDRITNDNAMASLAFLPLVGADLNILPITMISALPAKGDNVWEGSLFLFDGTGRVEANGDISTISMELTSKNNPEDKMNITGEYDRKKDSLQVIMKMNDGTETVFEFSASGNGYVSQMYMKGEADNSLVQNAFDEGKLYAAFSTVNGMPESIYQKDVSDWESFIKNDSLMVVIDKNKGFTILNGEKYEY